MKMILVFAIVSALFTTLLGSCHASPIIIEDSTAHLGLKRGEPSTRPSGNEPAPYSEVEPPSLLVCYFALDGNKSPTHDPEKNLIYNFKEFEHMGQRFTCGSQPAVVPLVDSQDRLCVLKVNAHKFDTPQKKYEVRGVTHNHHVLTFLGFTMFVYPDMLQNKEMGFKAECYPPEQSHKVKTDAKSIPWHDWTIRHWPSENGKKISVDALASQTIASQKGTSVRSSFVYYEQQNGYLGREFPVPGW
ncbi:uncharacterized protein C8R40DRAFT_176035 [Lentinula edodes]|uniref:uncharacterized protein n=1 Tax=Lentinula edodes TaxID=5353 RepID=UPI001E8D1230|nr:uncharacterized protein C8R40DRAFT_176035 [Lentinula edodes]KAH7875553.1 hypothetical protein C8R40DRAFT_176035 [Lentinula edodes]